MLPAAFWVIFLALVLGAIAWIDIRRHIIPDVLNLVLAAGGFAYSYWQGGFWAVGLAVTGAAAISAVLVLVSLVYRRQRGREGLGMGDVKLFSACALWVGPYGVSWLVLAACASALLTALVTGLLRRPFDAASRLPFGPHIAVGLAAILIIQTAL